MQRGGCEMSMQIELAGLVCLMLLALGAALECYMCDTGNDGSRCREKDPKTDKLDRYISDDKDTCYVCYKVTWRDDDGAQQTARGCGTEDQYDLYDVKKDKCKSITWDDDDAEMCICDSDKCNGSGHVSSHMTASLLAAVTSLALVCLL